MKRAPFAIGDPVEVRFGRVTQDGLGDTEIWMPATCCVAEDQDRRTIGVVFADSTRRIVEMRHIRRRKGDQHGR